MSIDAPRPTQIQVGSGAGRGWRMSRGAGATSDARLLQQAQQRARPGAVSVYEVAGTEAGRRRYEGRGLGTTERRVGSGGRGCECRARADAGAGVRHELEIC